MKNTRDKRRKLVKANIKKRVKKEKKRQGPTKKAKEPKKKIKKPPLKKEKKMSVRKPQGGVSLKSPANKPETRGVSKSVAEPNWKDEIKDMLLQMRKELLQDVSQSIKMESDHLRFDVGDFYDHASSDRDRELFLMITDREREKLIQIEEALRKIEDGSYGICESCGDEIGEDRLRAMPFAKLCLSCKIDLERQGREI
jgi:DnaK suppressor protein